MAFMGMFLAFIFLYLTVILTIFAILIGCMSLNFVIAAILHSRYVRKWKEYKEGIRDKKPWAIYWIFIILGILFWVLIVATVIWLLHSSTRADTVLSMAMPILAYGAMV